MRRLAALQRRKRTELAWVLAGFIFVQLGLALVVDQGGWALRDSEFDLLFRRLQQRRAAAPTQQLVLALGSSRTAMGLRPDRLVNLGSAEPVVVYNFAILGGGPMLDQVALRRLLAAGTRPDLLLIEVMPMSLSWRDGSPIEERYTNTARLSAGEVLRLWSYYHEPYRLLWRWVGARALPCYAHRAELYSALDPDGARDDEVGKAAGADRFGWRAGWGSGTPAEVEERAGWMLQRYGPALADPLVASGPTRAFHDLLDLCREEAVPVVLVIPPEGTIFRLYQPAVEEKQVECIAALAHEFAVPLVDARTWIDDNGFLDGHHLTSEAAAEYTERFGREVLRPYLTQNPAGQQVAHQR